MRIWYYILSVALCVGPVMAEDQTQAIAPNGSHEAAAASDEGELGVQAVAAEQGPTASPSPKHAISQEFFQGLGAANQGNLVEASQRFAKVREDLTTGGYANAPEFSFQLLRAADSLQEAQKYEEAKVVLDNALALSPNHPRIALAASSYVKVLGINDSLKTFFVALRTLPEYPVFAITLGLNIVLICGVALVLALLFVSVVQLLRSGEVLVKQLGRLFPRAFAGIAGAILLPLCLVGPLFLGLLAALAVWSIVLSVYKPNCRFYAVMVGGVILLWAWLVPNVRFLGLQMQSQDLQALEEINVGNFNPEREELLLTEVQLESVGLPAVIAAAFVAQDRGDLALARQVYQFLEQSRELPVSVRHVVALNSAVLQYQDRRFQDALVIAKGLEQVGMKSFELYHNMALFHMARLETDQYRAYYDRARALDAGRVDALDAAAVDGVALPQAGRLSLNHFWALSNMRGVVSAKEEVLLESLANALLRNGSVPMLKVVGIVTLAFGVFGAMGTLHRKHLRRKSTTFVTRVGAGEGSVLWCILPAGYAIAGRYPLAGALYLALVIGLLLVAFGAPMPVFELAPVEMHFAQPLIGLSALLLVLSMSWSLLLYRKSPYFEE